MASVFQSRTFHSTRPSVRLRRWRNRAPPTPWPRMLGVHVQVLQPDARLAEERRERPEPQRHAGDLAVDLGDVHRDDRVGPEHMAPELVGVEHDLVGQALERGQVADHLQDGGQIGRPGVADRRRHAAIMPARRPAPARRRRARRNSTRIGRPSRNDGGVDARERGVEPQALVELDDADHLAVAGGVGQLRRGRRAVVDGPRHQRRRAGDRRPRQRVAVAGHSTWRRREQPPAHRALPHDERAARARRRRTAPTPRHVDCGPRRDSLIAAGSRARACCGSRARRRCR